MAISRGAGTEIIRTAHFEDIDINMQKLIIGEQHHIYTVLSVTVYCHTIQATTNDWSLYMNGYDSKAGTSAQIHNLIGANIQPTETFVWNDKFSFNGHEPTDFAGPMDSVSKQNAIADQASSVAQYLYCKSTHADDNFEVNITYIDQNNA